jgi:transcriptional regulator with PAS, ATPase and Fis domain
MKKDVRDVSPEVVKILMHYDFPGNIRELENVIARSIALCRGDTIEPIHLPEDIRELEIWTFRNEDERYPSLEEREKRYILWILKKVGGNKTRAAEILGIDRISLWRKLKRYNPGDVSDSSVSI